MWAELPLNKLKDVMPINLGMILYAEASRLRADPALRPRAGSVFVLAGCAAETLHSALRRLTLNDGLAEELAWRGAAEAAIEAARIGAPETLNRFENLKILAPPPVMLRTFSWRGVIELTNAGRPAAARALMEAQLLTEPDVALDQDTIRDAKIILGQLALELDGNPRPSIALAEQIGHNDPIAINLMSGAFVHLVNACRYDEAADLHIWIERAFAKFGSQLNEQECSISFALGIFILQTGKNPHKAERAFSSIRRSLASGLANGKLAPVLFWEALRGECLSLERTNRSEEAHALLKAMLIHYRGAPDNLDIKHAKSVP
jgi:hypothetical protein